MGTNKNRPFLRFGFSIIVTLGAIVSAYTTYHGMVSTINISTNVFKFFIGLLMLFFILFQVWMWEFLLSKTLLNWLIDQKFEDDFEYVRKNTDKKLFVFFSVLPLFILFNFSISTHFSIITLGGSKANIEALKAYEKNYILEYQSLVNNKLRELSSKTIPELSSFKRTITEINLNENSISNDKGEILRNSKQLISETQSLILKIENNSNIDYKEIQNTLYNNIDNKNLKDLQKQIKLNIQKTKKIFLDKIYFVTEIKNKIKSLNTSLINSLKLIETKKSKTKFKKYIKRLDDTLNRLQLEQTRLNNLINKTYNINDIQEEIKNINNFKLESTSSLIYSKWTMIWDRFAIAILLDFVALILFPAFIGLIWYTNANSKKG